MRKPVLAASLVAVIALGRNDDMGALADFAFRGSRDTPAFPTLWGLE
jgi:hypothetical protein